MDDSNRTPKLTKRRTVLQLTSLAGGLGMLSSAVSASGNEDEAGRGRPNTETEILGDFESDFDGWTTTGGNKLERIFVDDFHAGVVTGQHGLLVDVNGDLHPMIENEQRVSNADFLEYPYLQMHVLTTAKTTDSDLHFSFRLHHSAPEANGPEGDGGTQNKDKLVVESDVKEVPQLEPTQVRWDMTDLSKKVLTTANRLEIVWHLEDYPPEGGHRGRSNGTFDYQGIVVFDDIRLFDTPPVSEEERLQDEKIGLHRKHGMLRDRTIQERSTGYERGSLTYSDGFTVSYSFEVLGDDQFQYTIGGKTFDLGGGWE